MAKAVFPSLRNIAVPNLKLIPDQMLQILIFFFANPGRTSSYNESEMVSFRDINSRYGNNPEAMCNECARALTDACSRYSTGAHVECSWVQDYHKDEDGVLQGTYKMDITVRDGAGIPIIEHQQVVITKNGDEIDSKFIRRVGA